jgi:CRP-like cAMP-binding protein
MAGATEQVTKDQRCTETVADGRVSAAALAELALFSSLDHVTLELLAKRLPVRVIDADDTVFEEGDRGRAMYVVLEGSVTMFKETDGGKPKPIAAAHPGEWFGELCLLDVMPRPVTARAARGTKLLAICPTDLRAVYRSNVKMYALLVMNMARQLSRKLRSAELSLARALSGEVARSTDAP